MSFETCLRFCPDFADLDRSLLKHARHEADVRQSVLMCCSVTALACVQFACHFPTSSRRRSHASSVGISHISA